MIFAHEDPEFATLIEQVGRELRLSPGLVEKDYWVTHTLWAVAESGVDLWFKGGTSLSKGFEIIERFSEDLDLKIEPGLASSLPAVTSWKSEGSKATASREAFFEALTGTVVVPGATLELDLTTDATYRSAHVRVRYPGRYIGDIESVLHPFVLLEVGNARVTPFVRLDMTSFVHRALESRGLLSAFRDNRPKQIACVHPLVTLLEKLDALHRRFPNEQLIPKAFVRHFEDAAKIIRATERLPKLEGYRSLRELADEMLRERQIAASPTQDDPAFNPVVSPRWQAIEVAHASIASMFWGPRISLDDCCAEIRSWVADEFG